MLDLLWGADEREGVILEDWSDDESEENGGVSVLVGLELGTNEGGLSHLACLIMKGINDVEGVNNDLTVYSFSAYYSLNINHRLLCVAVQL